MTTARFADEVHRGVTDLVERAEGSLAVAEAIGACADDINRSGYRALFSHLQLSEVDQCVLNLAKLFDPPPKKYPTRSIYAVLTAMENNASVLPVLDRGYVEDFLTERGKAAAEVERLPDADLTRAFVAEYRGFLEHAGPDGESPAEIVKRVRFRRDKEIAHNEAVDPKQRLQATWTDLRAVLKVAQDFLGMIGPTYMEFHFQAAGGSYMLSDDPHRRGKEMMRLLTRIGLGCEE